MLDGLKEIDCKANSINKYRHIRDAITSLDSALEDVGTTKATDKEYSSFHEMFDQLDILHSRMMDLDSDMEMADEEEEGDREDNEDNEEVEKTT